MSKEAEEPHHSRRYQPDLDDLRMIVACGGNHAAAYRRLIAERWTEPHPSYRTFLRGVRRARMTRAAQLEGRGTISPHPRPPSRGVAHRRRPSPFTDGGPSIGLPRKKADELLERLFDRARKAAS